MKIKNCVVGTPVEIKDLLSSPLESDTSKCFGDYGITDANGWEVSQVPDRYGDVKIINGDYTNPINDARYLWVHHTKLRLVKG